LRFSPIKRKSQKVECALSNALCCSSFVKGHQARLFQRSSSDLCL
jgi:hypothetical protein